MFDLISYIVSAIREERERLVEFTAGKCVTQLVDEIAASEAANIALNTLKLIVTYIQVVLNCYSLSGRNMQLLRHSEMLPIMLW